MMNKTMWARPNAEVNEFLTNEYVAACWGVGCAVDAANTWEKGHYWRGNTSWYDHDCTHASGHCGTNSNQVIYDDNDDGVADRMVETGTDGLGTLACTIYTDSDYDEELGVSSVKVGDYIYWTTESGTGQNKRVWHHQGTVYATVTGHPNRS